MESEWKRSALGHLVDSVFHYHPGAFTTDYVKAADYISPSGAVVAVDYANGQDYYAGTMTIFVIRAASVQQATVAADHEIRIAQVESTNDGPLCIAAGGACRPHSGISEYTAGSDTYVTTAVYTEHRSVVMISATTDDIHTSYEVAWSTALISDVLVRSTWPT